MGWMKPLQQNHRDRMHIGISIWLLFLGWETIHMQRNQNSYRNSTEQGKASPAVSELWHQEQLQDCLGSPERSSLATLVFFLEL